LPKVSDTPQRYHGNASCVFSLKNQPYRAGFSQRLYLYSINGKIVGFIKRLFHCSQ